MTSGCFSSSQSDTETSEEVNMQARRSTDQNWIFLARKPNLSLTKPPVRWKSSLWISGDIKPPAIKTTCRAVHPGANASSPASADKAGQSGVTRAKLAGVNQGCHFLQRLGAVDGT